ncbi:MAG: hypothetical protein WCT77_08395 [Bacteroidota bacterium]
MFLKILNYSIRTLIIVIGVLMVTGVLTPPGADPTIAKALGIIFILYGLYRIIRFRTRTIQLKKEEDEDENE